MPETEWIKTGLALIAAVVSVFFGIVAWLAKRQISLRDQEIQRLKEDVGDLLKLVQIVESLAKALDKEEASRQEIERQQWTKINANNNLLSDLRTTLSSHQTACQTRFLTLGEYDRLEQLKQRVDKERTAQQDQLARHVEQLIRLIQSRQRSGTT